MKRPLAVLAATIGCSVLLAGCVNNSGGSPGGGSAGGGSVASSQAPGEKVTLSYASYAFQDPTVKATQAIVDSWNAANPDIQVKYQKVDPNTPCTTTWSPSSPATPRRTSSTTNPPTSPDSVARATSPT